MSLSQRERYKQQSNWLRGVHYAPVGDEIELMAVCGVYERRRNPLGLVRDHVFPRYGGFKYRVFPELLRHPANCRFIPQSDNFAKRREDYAIDVGEIEGLFQRIEGWHGEWKEHDLCLQLIARYRRGDCHDPAVRKRRERRPDSKRLTGKPREFVEFTARRRAELNKLTATLRKPQVQGRARALNVEMVETIDRICTEISRERSAGRRRG